MGIRIDCAWLYLFSNMW